MIQGACHGSQTDGLDAFLVTMARGYCAGDARLWLMLSIIFLLPPIKKLKLARVI